MRKLVKNGLKLLGIVVAGLGLNELDKRVRYKADGYNRIGFDHDGFDRNGFDKEGFDRHGYNRAGFDRDGYNTEGYNARGYNRYGYNRDGRNERGFDRDGYDLEGYNWSGYDRLGYKRDGIDRSGNTKAYYVQKVSEMEGNSRAAHIQMKAGQFPYALRDIRVGVEKGIKAILAHKVGKGYDDNRLDYNIGVCSRNNVFQQEFIEKLYSAKMHCNDTAHDDYEKTYNQVHFSYKVLEKVIETLKQFTGLPNPM